MDARYMKSLQPGYQRSRRDRAAALKRLIRAVRENIGRKCLRGAKVSPMTRRLDKIREALAEYDAHA